MPLMNTVFILRAKLARGSSPPEANFNICAPVTRQIRLPGVLERQGLSLYLLSNLAMSLILKHFLVLRILRRP